MEDFSGGWVKLWRWIMDDRIFANDELFKVWMWCLMKTNHEDKTWVPVKRGRGQTEVLVQRGQLVFGRHSAAEELGKKPSTIYRQIKKLQDLQFLDTKPSTHWTIITIRNYDNYSGRLKESEQHTGQHLQSIRMPLTTSKESRESRELEEEEKSAPFDLFWKAYPRKVGKDYAKTCWKKKKGKPAIEVIVAAVEKWKADQRWKDDGGRYIPNPATWINQGRWEDELMAIEKPKPRLVL